MRFGYFTNFKSEPQLVLLSGTRAEFADLHRSLSSLTVDATISIHALDGVSPMDGTTLDVSLSSHEGISRTDEKSFECVMTPEGLLECLEKVQSLSSSRCPCHQYFESYPIDDAVIMMSVGEYDDAWWHRVAANLARAAESGVHAGSPRTVKDV